MERTSPGCPLTIPASVVSIVPLTTDCITGVLALDGTITVKNLAVPRLDHGVLSFDVRAVRPFAKRYGQSLDDPVKFIERPDQAGFVAKVGNRIVGCLLISEHWNRRSWIDGLVVESGSRRLGAGRALMAQAEAWTRSRGLPGIMLETQNVNVAACRFYERCGFLLGGFDQRLYRGFDPDTIEVALYWYRDLGEVSDQENRTDRG